MLSASLDFLGKLRFKLLKTLYFATFLRLLFGIFFSKLRLYFDGPRAAENGLMYLASATLGSYNSTDYLHFVAKKKKNKYENIKMKKKKKKEKRKRKT